MAPSISVVVPIFNAEEYLRKSLLPLKEALAQEKILELILVDDCSNDGSCIVAASFGFELIRSPKREGAAVARNLGASRAKGEILLFLDADVVAPLSLFDKVQERFAGPSQVCAVFGSYDCKPPAKGIVSRFRNLLHHHVHQKNSGRVRTFWTGCGAIKKAEFEACGGFNPQIWGIEDVELGLRLSERGKEIELDPDWQVSHLKRWTLYSMLRTDILLRALPWTRLNRRYNANQLNLNKREKIRALVALLAWCSLFFCQSAPLFTVICWSAAFIGNFDFYLLLYRTNGAVLALSGLILHQFYYLYSSLAWGIVRLFRL